MRDVISRTGEMDRHFFFKYSHIFPFFVIESDPQQESLPIALHKRKLGEFLILSCLFARRRVYTTYLDKMG